MNPAVYKTVKAYTDLLEHNELLRLSMFAITGDNPKILSFYDRISGLFQEEHDPPKLHELTKEAIIALSVERNG